MAKLISEQLSQWPQQKNAHNSFYPPLRISQENKRLKDQDWPAQCSHCRLPHCHRFSDNDTTRHKLIATPKISTRPCSTLNRQRRRPRLRHFSSSSCSSSSWASSAQLFALGLRSSSPSPGAVSFFLGRFLVTGFALAFDLGLGSSFWLLTVISGM